MNRAQGLCFQTQSPGVAAVEAIELQGAIFLLPVGVEEGQGDALEGVLGL